MSDLSISRYDSNEIAKQTDFNYGQTQIIENLNVILAMLFASTNDAIAYGLNVQQRGTPSMAVDITTGLAFCQSTGKMAQTSSLFGPVSIANGGAQQRIDVVELRVATTNYDTQQRAFRNPATGNITYQDWETKVRYEIETQVIQGTEGAGVAPAHTAGWIKVAEVVVDAGESTSILNADIKNVTAGYDGEATALWTNETTATFRTGNIEDIKSLFRISHDADGDHSDDVIKDNHIDWGTGAGQVNAADVPVVDTGGNFVGTTVEAVLAEIFNAFTPTTILASLSNGEGASLIGIEDAVGNFTATNVETALAEIFSRLVSTSSSQGASLVGIEDVGNYFSGSTVEAALQRIAAEALGLKGYMSLILTHTEWNDYTAPEVQAGSVVEINGVLCKITTNLTITGSTTNSTWYDILVTASGTSFTAAYVALSTGVWSATKQGFYSSNDRVIGRVYKDSSGNFRYKNVLQVTNGMCRMVYALGVWDFTTYGGKYIATDFSIPSPLDRDWSGLGAAAKDVVSVTAVVLSDFTSYLASSHTFQTGLQIQVNSDSTLGYTYIRVTVGTALQNVAYNDPAQNRGWALVTFRVSN